jgi:hypothetical protein
MYTSVEAPMMRILQQGTQALAWWIWLRDPGLVQCYTLHTRVKVC